MKEYISEIDSDRRGFRNIKKTRFGEIVRGLQLGGAYAFDEESYSRFYPLAKQEGLDVADVDFEKSRTEEKRFLIIQLV